MEFHWFSYVPDEEPYVTAFFPIAAITSANLTNEGFDLFWKQGSLDYTLAVICDEPALVLNHVLTGNLKGPLKKGESNIKSVRLVA